MHKHLLTVFAAVVVAFAGCLITPADAAPTHRFRQAYSCGYAFTGQQLALFVRAGHWTEGDGSVVANGTDGSGEPCFSELLDTWHPTVTGFTAVVRWYAGSRLLSTKRVVVRNGAGNAGVVRLNEPGFGIDCDAGDGVATLDGVPVSARTTITRKHYAAKVLVTTFFDDSSACGFARSKDRIARP